ncbi:hypothetical protein D3C85_579010 [compost metagenome]
MYLKARFRPPVLSPASLGEAAAASRFLANQRFTALAQRYFSGRSMSQNRITRSWSVVFSA